MTHDEITAALVTLHRDAGGLVNEMRNTGHYVSQALAVEYLRIGLLTLMEQMQRDEVQRGEQSKRYADRKTLQRIERAKRADRRAAKQAIKAR